jgi:hypothetical protein
MGFCGGGNGAPPTVLKTLSGAASVDTTVSALLVGCVPTAGIATVVIMTVAPASQLARYTRDEGRSAAPVIESRNPAGPFVPGGAGRAAAQPVGFVLSIVQEPAEIVFVKT